MIRRPPRSTPLYSSAASDVYKRQNMDYLTGEYEASLYGDAEETILRVSMECLDTSHCEKELVRENFLKSFLQYRPPLSEAHQDGTFNHLFDGTGRGGLEFYRIKGRPERLVDRRWGK